MNHSGFLKLRITKNIFLVLLCCISTLSILAQTNVSYTDAYFKDRFDSVDSLEEIGQYNSALEQVVKIKQTADMVSHTGYRVKCFRKILDLKSHYIANEDETEKFTLELFATELGEVKDWQYKALNDYRAFILMEKAAFIKSFYKRQIAEEIYNDTSRLVSDWSPQRQEAEILYCIDQSIICSGNLPFNNNYLPIFDNNGTYEFLPRLNGVMALQGIEILQSLITDNSNYTLPDTAKVFAGYKQFIASTFDANEGDKVIIKTLQLYQMVLSYNHVYFDLERYQYLNQLYNNRIWYLSSLKALYLNGPESPYLNLVALAIASEIAEENKAEAVKILNEALLKRPDFKQNTRLMRYRYDLQKPSVSASFEHINTPDKQPLFLLSYQNTDTVFVRIYKVNIVDYYKSIEDRYDSYKKRKSTIAFVQQLGKPLHDLKIKTMPFTDLEMHHVEMELPLLKSGVYIVSVANKQSWDDTLLQYSLAPVIVNDKVFVKKNREIYLVSAANGKAQQGVKYQLWRRKEDKFLLHSTGVSGQDGRIKIEDKSNNWYNNYIIETSDNSLYYDFGEYLEYSYPERDLNSIKILTDRAIYRPGQIVNFKCIAYNDKGKKTISKLKFTLKLTHNGELKQQKVLTTNSYGSASGFFQLPNDNSVGEFSLTVYGYFQSAYTSIKVEEYKLAKFKAEILPSTSAFKLNDQIVLTGKAMALAGYPVVGAKVSYKVSRVLRVPYYYFYRGFNTEDVQLKSAETVTDQNGNFDMTFLADPGQQVDVANAAYSFIISGNVTDLNGEVRAFSKDLNIYESDRLIDLMVDPVVLNTQPVSITYAVRTTENSPLPFTGTISVYKLNDVTEFKKVRFWEADTSVLSTTEYTQRHADYLPADYIPNRELMYSRQYFDDNGNSTMLDPTILIEPGRYITVLETKDSKGKTLKTETEFTVNEAHSKICKQNKVVQVYSLNGSVFEPGKTAKIALASGLKNQYVFVEVRSHRGLLFNKMVLLNESVEVIELPIVAKDRGNIVIQVYAVSHYRRYTSNLTLKVPYSNKELKVNVKSFRSDTEPGSKEKWILTLSGPASEKAAMEMAAVMYDAALDEIENHSGWNFWLYSDYNYSMSVNEYFNKMSSDTKIDIADKGYSYWAFNYPKMGLEDRYNYFRYYWNFGDGAGKGFYFNTAVSEKIKKEADDMTVAYDMVNTDRIAIDDKKEKSESSNPISIRKNFNETAFFFPHLYAGKNGEIQIEFTMPDALTKWRMQLLGHSTTMQLGYHDAYVTTSKKMMVQPNMPRFLRENDQIIIASKLINTTKQAMTLNCKIKITDAVSGRDLPWSGIASEKQITLGAEGIRQVSFPVAIPDYTGLVNITISAENGNYSDAEQHTLLVLSNRTMVQTSMPLTVRKAGTTELEFTELLKSTSTSLVHKSLSIEMCNNPSWYAVMALPYMMEYPNECAEQLFSRLYGNSISQYLYQKNPEMKQVFAQWLKSPSNGIGSMLSKNEELKLAVLTETPWLMEANNETERQAQLGKVFESSRMKASIEKSYRKLRDMQLPGGGFPWFSGMEDNVYITQTIVIGFGKLKAMGIDVSDYMPVISKAVNYIDQQAKRDYDFYIKDTNDILYPLHLNYLYAKMAFSGTGFGFDHEVVQYFLKHTSLHWNKLNYINKAQAAVVIKTMTPNSSVPQLIIKSFDDMAVRSEEMGMYWSGNKGGWYWYESPVETQAAIMEAYFKVSGNLAAIKEQQIWLLRQKQTQSWASTRSTADACYAILNYSPVLKSSQDVSVTLGSTAIVPAQKQAGTGYSITKVEPSKISGSMGKVTLNAKTSDFAYGAIHWQYFEDINKVEKNSSGLSIEKIIYVTRLVNGKQQKQVLGEKDSLSIGDVLDVVLSISSDRHLEYVHVKDQRASGTEPADVLSAYQWQNGLGYYQVTRDVSTNFFIDYLAKGKYQMSYKLYVQQSGNFSSGIATAQCMYAPEFIANSTSTDLKVR
jgi:uncharacterized protein YfaS (alpha-2-macroglobulin family)